MREDEPRAAEPRRVHFLTLGCPKNQVDSEVMLGVLARRGHEIVLDPAAADVLVVNTCSFITPAKEESIEAILDMARVKAGGTGQRLVVAGCLAQRYADQLRTALRGRRLHRYGRPPPHRGCRRGAARRGAGRLSWRPPRPAGARVGDACQDGSLVDRLPQDLGGVRPPL